MLYLAYLWITFFFLSQTILSQSPCTLPTQFQDSVWIDSDKGELVFDTVNMTGWEFNYVHGSQTIVEEWECYYTGSVGSKSYLILRCKQNVTYTDDIFTPYLCMELTEVSSALYYYYLLWAEQSSTDAERITVYNPDLGITDAVQQLCLDNTNPAHTSFYPETSEYHVLVKKGNEEDAKQECPTTFFGEYSYKVTDMASSTDLCGNGDEIWDVCTDYSRMTFNYSICNTEISYSANGSVFCLVSITSGSYVYHTVYNEDNTVEVSSGTYRFTCFMSSLASDGSLNVSQTPGSCKKGQTPTDQPVFASNSSAAGLNMQLTPRVLCPKASDESSGLSTGAIVGIVFGILIFIAAVILIILVCMKMKCRKEEKDKTPVTSPRSTKLSVDVDDSQHQPLSEWGQGPHGTAPIETRFSGDHKISNSPTLDHKYNPFSVLPLAKGKISNGDDIPNGVSSENPQGSEKTSKDLLLSGQTLEKPKIDIPKGKEVKTVSKSIQTEKLVIEDLDKTENYSNILLSSRNIYDKPVEKKKSSVTNSKKDSLPVQIAPGGFLLSHTTDNDVISRNSNVTPKAIVLETVVAESNTPDIQTRKRHSPFISSDQSRHERTILNEINNDTELKNGDKNVSVHLRSSGRHSMQSSVMLNQPEGKPISPTSGSNKKWTTEKMHHTKEISLKSIPPTESSLPVNSGIIKYHFKREDFKNTSFFQAPKTKAPGSGNEKNYKGKKKNKVIIRSHTNAIVKETQKKPKKSRQSHNAKGKPNKSGQQAFTSLMRSNSTGVNRNKKGKFYNEDIPIVETECYLNISETKTSNSGICYDEDNERARALGYWSNNDKLETNISCSENVEDAGEGNAYVFESALGTSENRSVSRPTLDTDISARGSLSNRSFGEITSRIGSRGAKYFIENETSSIAINVRACDVPDDLGVTETLNGGAETSEHDQDEEDDEYEDEYEDEEDFGETEDKNKEGIQTSMSVFYGSLNEDEEEDPDRMVLDGYEPELLAIKE